MNDLISRQALIRMFNCNGLCGNSPEEDKAEAIEFIKMQPTAYDMHKVTDKINHYKKIMQNNYDESKSLQDKEAENYYRGRMSASVDILEIVKGGGIDE